MSNRVDPAVCPACGGPTERPYLDCAACRAQRIAERAPAASGAPAPRPWRDPWTPEEEALLIATRHLAAGDQMRLLNRSWGAINNRRALLRAAGRLPSARMPRWSAEDDAILRELDGQPARIIAARLGRTTSAVHLRRHKLRGEHRDGRGGRRRSADAEAVDAIIIATADQPIAVAAERTGLTRDAVTARRVRLRKAGRIAPVLSAPND